jgi:hypothetical protein
MKDNKAGKDLVQLVRISNKEHDKLGLKCTQFYKLAHTEISPLDEEIKFINNAVFFWGHDLFYQEYLDGILKEINKKKYKPANAFHWDIYEKSGRGKYAIQVMLYRIPAKYIKEAV